MSFMNDDMKKFETSVKGAFTKFSGALNDVVGEIKNPMLKEEIVEMRDGTFSSDAFDAIMKEIMEGAEDAADEASDSFKGFKADLAAMFTDITESIMQADALKDCENALEKESYDDLIKAYNEMVATTKKAADTFVKGAVADAAKIAKSVDAAAAEITDGDSPGEALADYVNKISVGAFTGRASGRNEVLDAIKKAKNDKALIKAAKLLAEKAIFERKDVLKSLEDWSGKYNVKVNIVKLRKKYGIG